MGIGTVDELQKIIAEQDPEAIEAARTRFDRAFEPSTSVFDPTKKTR